MKVYIYTLGCKVNQYESQQMEDALNSAGFDRACKGESADVYIVNSCAVTATAVQKTRQTLSKIRRDHPEAIVCLTGCVPQAFPTCGSEGCAADIIIGNSNREKLTQYILQYAENGIPIINIEEHTKNSGLGGTVSGLGERARAYIKIEDGCNRFCSYCIIPYARGRVRSRTLQDIVSEAKALSTSYREVVLVGINLSAYGSDIGLSLLDAVREIEKIDGIDRIRLGSMEPDLLTPDVLSGLAACKKFCPQFHISLQSGCDATLKRMNRHYTSDEYYRLVCDIRDNFENPSVTTDVMCGFVGETDDEFNQSLDFVRKVGFAKTHCFIYSKRKGTKAYDMEGHVKPEVASSRMARLLEAAQECENSFFMSQIGSRAEVLVERPCEDGFVEGFSKNYTPIRIKGDYERGSIISVTITGTNGEYCTAE
ncbi:MAG: tRNA (N(6)-L-threonylcarbamoyladenosine(37)-C(2))-methylthiotransferase MtaB [Ruminococcaceae bacterium]|nr:tRNA (N(6)-L-threonylcarbamoyladenosine(37)-C(2))-methylthiotransferase MtaB [Oscillospiraceae bacterium]